MTSQSKPVTTLLIARHGNTFATGDVVTRVGRTDLPLVASGRNQGRMLGCYLQQQQLIPHVIFTSHLQRTQQTADEIETAMSLTVPRFQTDIFNEIDYGPDENQPEDAVRARVGNQAIKAWDEQAIIPDGWLVNPPEIIQAWKTFASEIEKSYRGQTVLVVTSNGIARFAAYLIGDAEAFGQQWGLKLATGALGHFTKTEQSSHWKCKGWNIRPDKG